MGALFRSKFLRGVRKLHHDGRIASDEQNDIEKLVPAMMRKRWVAYCQKPFRDADAVYAYLGRYTHRVGISNSRLLHVDDETADDIEGGVDQEPEYLRLVLELTGVDLRACPACEHGRMVPEPLPQGRAPP